MTDVRIAAHLVDELGEGPCWVAGEMALYWVDIFGQSIRRLEIASGLTETWALDQPVGFIVPREPGNGYIVGLQTGIHHLQFSPFRLELLCDPESDDTASRFNDGTVDARGHLWAGTMDLTQSRPTGTLYRFDPDLVCHKVDEGYLGTNGPAFAPAGDVLYHADSPRKLIYRLALDDDRSVREKSLFITFDDPNWGEPDGMTTDSEGCLWVAHWDGGRVSRFDPSGNLMQQFFLPASRITSCTFGGAELDRLFVTSARYGRGDEQSAGALFEIDVGIRGMPSNRFGQAAA